MANSYFSEPEKTLDPSLFDGESLKSEVRGFILSHLYSALQAEGFHDPKAWTHIWLAGSGITYQWTNNTDLDVLFGVDISTFALHNPGYEGFGQEQLAQMINSYLKANLWPMTADTSFGGKSFELTFFVNPDVQADIAHIRPYAAYDVVNDSWSVRPPSLPSDPRTLYPAKWFDYTVYDQQATDRLVRAYDRSQADLMSYPVGSPRYHDAGRRSHLSAAEAIALYSDIHVGRREAFQGVSGQGYGDYANFRWQRAKDTGVIDSLKSVIHMQRATEAQEDVKLYGQSLPSVETLIARAMGSYRDRT